METKSISITVGKPLWKAISVAAMEQDKTLAEVVVPVLEKEFSAERVDLRRRADGLRKKVEALSALPPTPDVEPSIGKCWQCKDDFLLGQLTTLPILGGELKPFCQGCIDNIKNGQA